MSCGRAPGVVEVQAARRIVASVVFSMLGVECMRQAGFFARVESLDAVPIQNGSA
jgi:hypothetical protein